MGAPRPISEGILMSRASMKAKKTWHHRKRRSTFKRTRDPDAGRAFGGYTTTGGLILDLPALVAQVNRLFRGRSSPRQ